MGDYIPRPDAEYLAWGKNFLGYLAPNAAALGLLPADVTPIGAGVTLFETTFTTHNTAQQNAQSAKEAKNGQRKTSEDAIRSLVRRIQANPSVTDAQRAALGITVRDEVRTRSSAVGGESRPVGAVDTGQRLRHEISFTDESTPTRRARPEGTMGCEIWVAIKATGEPAPTDPSQLTFLTLDTATPYLAEYDGADAGKTAHYMLRWARTNGEKGPWSETVSATIVG